MAYQTNVMPPPISPLKIKLTSLLAESLLELNQLFLGRRGVTRVCGLTCVGETVPGLFGFLAEADGFLGFVAVSLT